MEFWATIAENVLSKQPARSSSAAGAPWSFSRRALRTNRRVVHCAEKPEFVWWPLPMPPAFCTSSAPDQCHAIPHEHSSGTHSAPQSIHAFRQNSLSMRSGSAAVFVSSAKPGSRHPRLLARHNYSSRSFGTSSILLLEAAAMAIYASEIPPCRRLHPIAHGTFPIRLSNLRGRLRPTVE